MKNTVIYARYSGGSRQTEQSIEGQLHVCEEYAAKHDLRIVGTYIDRKISGRTDNRENFQRMIADSAKHMFEVVLVYRTDRFARNKYDSAVYKQKLRKNGIEIKYAAEAIPEGPEGIILESLMEGLAEYYSAELSQKIKRGMRESALKAHSTGAGHCLGYKTAPDKSIIVDPEGAKAVQTVFDMYIKGGSQADICDYLNGLGFRTSHGNLFNKNSIYHIIKNKRYIGTYTYGDIVLKDAIPAIVSKETFHLAQLEAERRRKRRRPNSPKAEYLLSGKLFCGHCKSAMIGISGTGKTGNKWYYYCCPNARHKNGCHKKPVRRDWLEDLIVNKAIEEVLRPDIIQHISEACYEMQVKYQQENDDIAFYKAKIAETKKAIKNVAKAIESGAVTKSLPARLKELEDEQEALEAELAIAQKTSFIIKPEQIEYLLYQFVEPLDNEDWAAYKKRIIKCFVSQVYLYDDKLLIYYNVSRDGKTRLASDLADLEDLVEHGFDRCSSRSTITSRYFIVKHRLVIFLCRDGWHCPLWSRLLYLNL